MNIELFTRFREFVLFHDSIQNLKEFKRISNEIINTYFGLTLGYYLLDYDNILFYVNRNGILIRTELDQGIDITYIKVVIPCKTHLHQGVRTSIFHHLVNDHFCSDCNKQYVQYLSTLYPEE